MNTIFYNPDHAAFPRMAAADTTKYRLREIETRVDIKPNSSRTCQPHRTYGQKRALAGRRKPRTKTRG